MFQVHKIRELFPLSKKIVYFDNAAGSLKPITMLKKIEEYFYNYSVSTRTSETKMANWLQIQLDSLRSKVALLVACQKEEVIFTSGATESLNLIIQMAAQILKPGDEVIIAYNNHSSNVAPWYLLRQEIGIKLIISETILDDISDKTKIIALSQKSNNFKNLFDYQKVAKIAQAKKIFLLNDAAQAINYQKVSLKTCDAITLSANKMFGPTGVGFLILKKSWMDLLKPVKVGGGSIVAMDLDNLFFQKNFAKFESGTLNLQNLVATHAGLDFLAQNFKPETLKHLENLSNYLWQKLEKLQEHKFEIIQKGEIFLLSFKDYDAQDVASYLGVHNIYARSGKFCAFLSCKSQSLLRLSLSYYNTFEEIDYLIQVLKKTNDFLVI